MEATMEQCSSDFDAPGVDKMEQEELQPFESVTLPPIKIEEEEEEEDEGDAGAEDEAEEEEDFGSSGNFLSTSMSPVKDEAEVPAESEEEEEEIEPSSFLSVSMTTIKEEPEEQQEEDDEELEPLASVTVASPMDEVLPKEVPRSAWGEQLQQQISGRRVVSSSGVWVPGVEDPSPSAAPSFAKPQPPSAPAAAPSKTRKPFSCDVCAKSFTQKYTLKMHRRVHSEKMPFRCRACPESFESPSALALHVAFHKAQRRYPCDVCGASFIQKGELNIHLRSHSEARPHECTLCDKAYKQKPNEQRNDVPLITRETTNISNLMESSGINYASQDKEKLMKVVNEGGPTTGQKRRAKKSRLVGQPVDENNISLKETIAETKVAKDESQLFCELLSMKLRALNDDACEIAMYEINNFMYHLKNSRMLQSNDLPLHHYCQQPDYVQNDVKQFPMINQLSVPVCKSQDSSVSQSLLRGLLQEDKKMK